MKWRNYKKRVRKLVGKNNCKFKKIDGEYYQAIRINEALSYVTNCWMRLGFSNKNKLKGE